MFCGGDVVSKSAIIHVMNQEKTLDNVDVQELKEREIKEESMETRLQHSRRSSVKPLVCIKTW